MWPSKVFHRSKLWPLLEEKRNRQNCKFPFDRWQIRNLYGGLTQSFVYVFFLILLYINNQDTKDGSMHVDAWICQHSIKLRKPRLHIDRPTANEMKNKKLFLTRAVLYFLDSMHSDVILFSALQLNVCLKTILYFKMTLNHCKKPMYQCSLSKPVTSIWIQNKT